MYTLNTRKIGICQTYFLTKIIIYLGAKLRRPIQSEAINNFDRGSKESLSSDKPPHWIEVTKVKIKLKFNIGNL